MIMKCIVPLIIFFLSKIKIFPPFVQIGSKLGVGGNSENTSPSFPGWKRVAVWF